MAKIKEETYVECIITATLREGMVRVDFGEMIEPPQDQPNKARKPLIKHRLIMPMQSFANSVQVMQELLKRVEEAQRSGTGGGKILAPEIETKQ